MDKYEFTIDGGKTLVEVKDGSSIVSFAPRTVSFRIKPRTIKVNGFDVPEPMSEAPIRGSMYFAASPADNGYSEQYFWYDDETDSRFMSRNICHTTKESAIAHAKAMLGIDPNGGE